MRPIVSTTTQTRTIARDVSAPVTPSSMPSFAGSTIVGRLAAHRLGRRWLIRDAATGIVSVAYCLERPRSGTPASSAELAVRLVSLRGAHLLPIQRVEFDVAGRTDQVWLVTPYTGSADGLATLGRVLSEKPQSRMDSSEVARAVSQLLMALDDLHRQRVAHGPVRIDEALVDRRGRVLIELPCVEAMLARESAPDVGGEVRSVVAIAHELLTGVPAGAQGIDRGVVSRSWAAWFARGLSEPCGFSSAAAALAAMTNLRA